MTELKPHEKRVLDILVSGNIPNDVLQDIKSNAKITDYDVSENGYLLTVTHPSLPTCRKVCNEPMVIGEFDGTVTGFVVFIENGELTIECHAWGDIEIPTNFRELGITIRLA